MLKHLDVSNIPGLKVLYCSNNQLTSLDVSKNTMLVQIYCHYNQLTDLDVSNLNTLYALTCSYNQFSAAGLNALFKTLHNNYVNNGVKWIVMNANPGSTTCDKSIATGKGWIFN